MLAAVAGGLVGVLLVATWDYQERGVRVVAVGTEHGISVLVTSGHRRVLIESGATGRSFDHGLDAHLTPLHRDLDIVLVDPDVDATAAPSRASSRRWSLGSSTIGGVETLDTSTSISLPDDLSIEVLLEPGPVGEDRGWVVMISRGTAVLGVAGSDDDWVTSVIDGRGPGVVIAATDGATASPDRSSAPLTVLARRVMDGSTSSTPAQTIVALSPGESMVFRLHDRGIEVPDAIADRLAQRAAMPRTSSRPLLGTRSSNSRRISARSSSERSTSRPARAIAPATLTAFR